jgi:hypothetical protein
MTNLTLVNERRYGFLSKDISVSGKAFENFIDNLVTASSRATFYNTEKEQIETATQIHKELMSIDRGLYGICLLLPGIMDFSKQLGISALLKIPTDGSGLLTAEEEKKLVNWLTTNLPPQRMLKMFAELKNGKVNNSRTRGVILSCILGSSKLEPWSVKYRTKIRITLKHAWGERLSSIIVSVLKKNSRTAKENRIISNNIDKYLDTKNNDNVYQCIRFIFKDESNIDLKLLKAYVRAKEDFEKGCLLPYEVMEGIRSTFHTEKDKSDVLKLTRRNLTTNQRIAFQKKAKADGVAIAFNPKKYDSVRLYLYAYEMGMTDDIKNALSDKAKESAFYYNLEDKKAGILVDCSQSMMGPDTQKLRPMATALAMRDALIKAAKSADVVYCGENEPDDYDMVVPAGGTSLEKGLVDLMLQQPDVIFILSDGYENSPSGRVDEVMRNAKSFGIDIPVMHFSPVMASEAKSIRKLSNEITSLPAGNTDSTAIGLLKGTFSNNPALGLRALLKIVRPTIEKTGINYKMLSGE